VFELFVLFDILEHPVTADIVLMPSSNTEKSSMITYYRSTKLGNIVLKVNKIFRLLVCSHIIKMNVFVTPLKVMNNPLIGKLLLYNKYVLKEVDNPLLDIEMIEFGYHCLLIFKVSFVLVDQSIPFINDISYVVKDRTVSAHV
jgi:hypothetical protein